MNTISNDDATTETQEQRKEQQQEQQQQQIENLNDDIVKEESDDENCCESNKTIKDANANSSVSGGNGGGGGALLKSVNEKPSITTLSKNEAKNKLLNPLKTSSKKLELSAKPPPVEENINDLLTGDSKIEQENGQGNGKNQIIKDSGSKSNLVNLSLGGCASANAKKPLVVWSKGKPLKSNLNPNAKEFVPNFLMNKEDDNLMKSKNVTINKAGAGGSGGGGGAGAAVPFSLEDNYKEKLYKKSSNHNLKCGNYLFGKVNSSSSAAVSLTSKPKDGGGGGGGSGEFSFPTCHVPSLNPFASSQQRQEFQDNQPPKLSILCEKTVRDENVKESLKAVLGQRPPASNSKTNLRATNFATLSYSYKGVKGNSIYGSGNNALNASKMTVKNDSPQDSSCGLLSQPGNDCGKGFHYNNFMNLDYRNNFAANDYSKITMKNDDCSTTGQLFGQQSSLQAFSRPSTSFKYVTGANTTTTPSSLSTTSGNLMTFTPKYMHENGLPFTSWSAEYDNCDQQSQQLQQQQDAQQRILRQQKIWANDWGGSYADNRPMTLTKWVDYKNSLMNENNKFFGSQQQQQKNPSILPESEQNQSLNPTASLTGKGSSLFLPERKQSKSKCSDEKNVKVLGPTLEGGGGGGTSSNDSNPCGVTFTPGSSGDSAATNSTVNDTTMPYQFSYFKGSFMTPPNDQSGTNFPVTNFKMNSGQSSSFFRPHVKPLDISSGNVTKTASLTKTNTGGSGLHPFLTEDGKTNFSELIAKSSEELNFLYKKLQAEKKYEKHLAMAPMYSKKARDALRKRDVSKRAALEAAAVAVNVFATKEELLDESLLNAAIEEEREANQKLLNDNQINQETAEVVEMSAVVASLSEKLKNKNIFALEPKDSDNDEGHELKRCSSKFDLPKSFGFSFPPHQTKIDFFGDYHKEQQGLFSTPDLKDNKDYLEMTLQASMKEPSGLPFGQTETTPIKNAYTFSKALEDLSTVAAANPTFTPSNPVVVPLYQQVLNQLNAKQATSLSLNDPEESHDSKKMLRKITSSPNKLNPQAEPFKIREDHLTALAAGTHHLKEKPSKVLVESEMKEDLASHSNKNKQETSLVNDKGPQGKDVDKLKVNKVESFGDSAKTQAQVEKSFNEGINLTKESPVTDLGFSARTKSSNSKTKMEDDLAKPLEGSSLKQEISDEPVLTKEASKIPLSDLNLASKSFDFNNQDLTNKKSSELLPKDSKSDQNKASKEASKKSLASTSISDPTKQAKIICPKSSAAKEVTLPAKKISTTSRPSKEPQTSAQKAEALQKPFKKIVPFVLPPKKEAAKTLKTTSSSGLATQTNSTESAVSCSKINFLSKSSAGSIVAQEGSKTTKQNKSSPEKKNSSSLKPSLQTPIRLSSYGHSETICSKTAKKCSSGNIKEITSKITTTTTISSCEIKEATTSSKASEHLIFGQKKSITKLSTTTTNENIEETICSKVGSIETLYSKAATGNKSSQNLQNNQELSHQKVTLTNSKENVQENSSSYPKAASISKSSESLKVTPKISSENLQNAFEANSINTKNSSEDLQIICPKADDLNNDFENLNENTCPNATIHNTNSSSEFFKNSLDKANTSQTSLKIKETSSQKALGSENLELKTHQATSSSSNLQENIPIKASSSNSSLQIKTKPSLEAFGLESPIPVKVSSSSLSKNTADSKTCLAISSTSKDSLSQQDIKSSPSVSPDTDNPLPNSESQFTTPQTESIPSTEDNACGGGSNNASTSSSGLESKDLLSNSSSPLTTTTGSALASDEESKTTSSKSSSFKNFKFKLEELRELLLPHLNILTSTLSEQQRAKLAAELQGNNEDKFSVSLTITEAIAATLLNEQDLNKNILSALNQMEKEALLQKQGPSSLSSLDFDLSTLTGCSTLDLDLYRILKGDKNDSHSDSSSLPQAGSSTSKESSNNSLPPLNVYAKSMLSTLEKLLKKDNTNKLGMLTTSLLTSSSSQEPSSSTPPVCSEESNKESSTTEDPTTSSSLPPKESPKPPSPSTSTGLKHTQVINKVSLNSKPKSVPPPKVLQRPACLDYFINIKKPKEDLQQPSLAITKRDERVPALSTGAPYEKKLEKKITTTTSTTMPNKKDDLKLKKIPEPPQPYKKSSIVPSTKSIIRAKAASRLHEKATMVLTARKETSAAQSAIKSVNENDKKRKNPLMDKVIKPLKMSQVPQIDAKSVTNIHRRITTQAASHNSKPVPESRPFTTRHGAATFRGPIKVSTTKISSKESSQQFASLTKRTPCLAKGPVKNTTALVKTQKCESKNALSLDSTKLEVPPDQIQKEHPETKNKAMTSKSLNKLLEPIDEDYTLASGTLRPEQNFRKASSNLSSPAGTSKRDDFSSTPFANLPNVLKDIMGAPLGLQSDPLETLNVNICEALKGEKFTTPRPKPTPATTQAIADLTKTFLPNEEIIALNNLTSNNVDEEAKKIEEDKNNLKRGTGISTTTTNSTTTTIHKNKSSKFESNDAYLKSFSARGPNKVFVRSAAPKTDSKTISQSARPSTSRRPSPASARTTKGPRETVASALRKIEAQKRQNLFPDETGNDSEFNIKMSQYIFK